MHRVTWALAGNARYLTPDAAEYCREIAAQWLESAEELPPAAALAWYHRDIRLGRWNMARLLQQCGAPVVQPFLDSQVILRAMELPIEVRADERAFFSILEELNPTLASLPLATSGWRFDEASRPMAAPDAVYNWRSHLSGRLGQELLQLVEESPSPDRLFAILDRGAFERFAARVRGGEVDYVEPAARFLWSVTSLSFLWNHEWTSPSSGERRTIRISPHPVDGHAQPPEDADWRRTPGWPDVDVIVASTTGASTTSALAAAEAATRDQDYAGAVRTLQNVTPKPGPASSVPLSVNRLVASGSAPIVAWIDPTAVVGPSFLTDTVGAMEQLGFTAMINPDSSQPPARRHTVPRAPVRSPRLPDGLDEGIGAMVFERAALSESGYFPSRLHRLYLADFIARLEEAGRSIGVTAPPTGAGRRGFQSVIDGTSTTERESTARSSCGGTRPPGGPACWLRPQSCS